MVRCRTKLNITKGQGKQQDFEYAEIMIHVLNMFPQASGSFSVQTPESSAHRPDQGPALT